MKRQTQKKIIPNDISDKGLVPEQYEEKKPTWFFLNGQIILKDILPYRCMDSK